MPRIRITGMLPKAQYGMTTNTDPDDDWIRKMLEFEFKEGGYDDQTGKSKGLSNWGYNAPKGYYYDDNDRKYKQKGTGQLLNGTGVWTNKPKTIDEAIALYKKEYLPDVANLPIELRQRVGDFNYNAGRDYRIYMLDNYLKSNGKPGLADRGKFNKDVYNPKEWTPALKNEFETLWNQYKKDIDSLPIDKQADLVDQGRDTYYQNINTVGGKPNPAYDATWKKRIKPSQQQNTQQGTTSPTQQTPPAQQTTITGNAPDGTVVVNTPNGPVSKPADQPTDKVDTPPPSPTSKVDTAPPATKINTPVFPTPTAPVPKAPAQTSRFHPEWEEEDIDPERDLPVSIVKTPYKVPTGPVATMQGPVLQNPPKQQGTDIWAQTNVDITSKSPQAPVNPNVDQTKQYPINYDELNKGTPTKIYEEDIIDPTDELKRRRRKDQWQRVKYAATHPGETIGKGANWLNDKITQGAQFLNENEKFQKYAGKAEDIVKGATAITPIVDYITNIKKQKRWDKYFTENSLSDNLYAARPASMTGNRGDWDINTGIFRPNEIGFKSKGQYTNQFNYSAPGTGVASGIAAYGGSINNNPMEKVRIRITGGGTEKMATGGQPMTYSGQLGYGINLGQKRIYTDMPPDKADTVNNTLQAVPRDQANIEAEKGETVFGDIDGDGALEHMLIGGKKHTQGGTPLNVPEGSFIFSDTKDLIIKDRKILDKFNMPANKKGYTPAEIAKKYEMNKYKAIMEDVNADPIKKSTAQIMIKTFQKKLAELALIQEQMKGFPQGIPEIAKKLNPKLQTKEDQQKQPGLSDNLQFGQPQGQEQGPQEEMMMQGSEEQGMEPQMEYGGMIPKYLLAGEVDTETSYNPNNYLVSSGLIGSGPGDPGAVEQTYTPQQRASLNDPEYKIFMDLMKKADTGKYKSKGAYYVNKLTPAEAAEFARLATKFGFKRNAEGAVGTGDSPTYNAAGYRIIQGATPGYSMTDPKTKKKFGFVGGFTPDLYEKRVIEDVYGKDASDRMTDIERRRAYFKELGIDDSKFSDARLANPKVLYQNQDFFKNTFYPAFTKTFGAGSFRPEMQDDMFIGAEHYDSYKTKTQPGDDTIIGFKCTGRDATTGKANIISNSYMNVAARNADGAVATETAAYVQCPEEPVKPGTPGDPCPEGYYRDENGDCVKIPWDYMTPDKVNMMAAAAVPPNKYLPWGQKLPFEPGDVVFKDWRAKAAERQSLINRMGDQLNTYSPGAATASNLSFLAGQQAEGLIKDIDDVDSYNVQVANAFTDRERQRKDQNNMLNLAKSEELYKGNVIANQQYDNARRAYFNNMAKTYGQAWKNRMQLGLLNAVNPMFNIDPWEGQSHFKGGYTNEELGNALFGSTASSGTTYRDRLADYLKRGYTLADARKYAAEDDRKGSTAGTGTTAKKAAALQARSLLGGYGGLGSGFNPEEEATTTG